MFPAHTIDWNGVAQWVCSCLPRYDNGRSESYYVKGAEMATPLEQAMFHAANQIASSDSVSEEAIFADLRYVGMAGEDARRLIQGLIRIREELLRAHPDRPLTGAALLCLWRERRPSTESGMRVWGCLGAVLGALLVHPLLILIVFVLGTVYGCSGSIMSSGPGPPPEYGLKGGGNAVLMLYFWYLMTLGILPVIVSLGGAAVGGVVGKIFGCRG
jgi:hypothetical protein